MGSQPKDTPRVVKHAKALRVARWQVWDVIHKAPSSTPTALLRHIINTTFVTDVLSLTAYHLVPILELPDFVLVVKDSQLYIPDTFESLADLLDVCTMILQYKVRSFFRDTNTIELGIYWR